MTPIGVSFEYNFPDLPLFDTTVSHRGEYTIFGQFQNRWRTYHMDPSGDISPPSPTTEWTNNYGSSSYYAWTVTTSRDGRVIISGGSSFTGPFAISHWVADDGTVTEIDRLFHDDPENPLVPGNISDVLISPRREWMLMQGDRTGIWALNPDGSFGDLLWSSEPLETGPYGHADISGDGRVAAVGHYLYVFDEKGGWELKTSVTILRLSPEGIPVSITHNVNEVPGITTIPRFITRRCPGDANGDGWIDIADLVTLMNHLRLGAEIGNPVDLDHADVDRDGDRDDDDLEALVGMLLGL